MKKLSEIFKKAKIVDDGVELSRRLITPEAAQMMLENNAADNRNIKKDVVAKYVRDLETGNWEASNPGVITLWEDGTMVDGQHRLTAIVKSGISVPMTIAIVPSGVSLFDTQAKRSDVDYFKMKHDVTASNQLMCALTMYCSYSLGISKANAPTSEEKWDVYAENPERWNAANKMASGGKRSAVARRGYAVFAAYNAMAAGVSEDVVDAFFKVVNSGYPNSQKDNQAIAARNSMLEWKDKKGNVKNRTDERECTGILEEYIRLFANGSVSKRSINKPTWCYSNLIKKEAKTE